MVETPICGAFVLEFEPVRDERGYFVRRFCKKTFAEHGLCVDYQFDSSSMNTSKYTLRGMHFQAPPFEETKLISCSKGAVFDVIVDARKDSQSHAKWFGIDLKEADNKALYIPPGCAHGFITLTENTVVDYKLNGEYSPQHSRGFRFDDQTLSIRWPALPLVIIERDKNLPPFTELQ